MKLIVDGQLVEYKDTGEGKVLLLLHGWGASLGTYDELATILEKRFRVIRFDFPGFGSSPKPEDSWGVSEYARLTASLLQKLKIDQVYAIIGHSFGGRVIIKGTSLGMLKSDKVVLISAAGIKPAKSVKKQALKAVAKTGKVVASLPGIKRFRSSLRGKLYAAAGSSDYLEAESMQRIFLNTINEDLLPEVAAAKQPTLLIWGEDDRDTPLGDAYKMKDKLEKAELHVIPNSGHFVYLDAPAAVITELEKFL
ncbi:MAG: alpha/beta hydrolase [Candidatus Saccharimonas sp.]